MKLRFIVAIASAALFTSCQKDFSEEYGTISQSINTATAASLGSNNCKASAYFPICSGSEYHYTDTRGRLSLGSSVGAPIDYTLTYLGDTTIDRLIYQKIKGTGNQVSFYNNGNGALTQLILNRNSLTNAAVPYYKFTIVKSNEPVGATWRDVILLPNDPSEIHDYTIIAKGLTRTVFGITYNDVIQIRENISSANYGTAPYLYINQYMAKGVGLIESVSSNDLAGTSIMVHRKLMSATISQ
jgi:hypothetical protein